MDLEQRCIRPGLWLIEGREVERIGRRKWLVRHFGSHWVARSWMEARKSIAEEIEQARPDRSS